MEYVKPRMRIKSRSAHVKVERETHDIWSAAGIVTAAIISNYRE